MKEEPCLFSAFFKLLWVAAMLAAIVSGLAHLPFAFRYGLINSWRASPTVAHYWSAAALLLLGTYAAVVWLAAGRRRYALTCLGGLRVTLLVVLAVTGLLLVLHNLPGFSCMAAPTTSSSSAICSALWPCPCFCSSIIACGFWDAACGSGLCPKCGGEAVRPRRKAFPRIPARKPSAPFHCSGVRPSARRP